MSVLLKIRGGLSRPVTVQRGIRLMSAMLYALTIEPLLNQLRQDLTGLNFDADASKPVSLSASQK